MIELWLPGPTPWRRQPQLNRRRGKIYPHPDTEKGILRWRGAWLASSRQQILGPVSIVMQVRVRRPPSHLKRTRELNSRGLREPFPRGKPDVDNMAKLALDALKGYAIGDDASVISLLVTKAWAQTAGETGCRLTVEALGAPEAAVESFGLDDAKAPGD